MMTNVSEVLGLGRFQHHIDAFVDHLHAKRYAPQSVALKRSITIAFGRLRIPMMVMGDSDLIVMVVSERNDHHDRSEATLTLRWCLN